MSANTSPIFVGTPQIQWSGSLTTGYSDTTGADGVLLFTAGSNGGKVEQITCTSLGSNAATMVRIFVNNGSSIGTPANNSLILEIPLAANTESTTAANVAATVTTNIYLASGYKLYCSLAATVSAGVQVTAQGGSF